jgi:integrase
MLDWEEDVLPMIEAAQNSRDAAAIALQFDAGLRGGEFEDLTVGDITDNKHGLQITVDGKRSC